MENFTVISDDINLGKMTITITKNIIDLSDDKSVIKFFNEIKDKEPIEIGKILNEEANKYNDFGYFPILSTNLDERMNNWKKWYSFKTLAELFNCRQASIDLKHVIDIQIDSQNNIFYQFDEQIDGQKAETFVWKQLAYIDPNYRASIIEAYRSGQRIVKNEARALYWESYN